MSTTILIADDQAEIRDALELLVAADPALELVGLAEDAEKAITLARLHQPDVALVDVKMPAGGGARATREIKTCSPATRVLALSAYGDRNSVFEMLRAGAAGYLVKGASAAEIHAAITRSAQGEHVLSAAVTADVVHELAEQLARESAGVELVRERAARIRRVLDEGLVAIVFQPIVELHGRRVVGYEALSRFSLDAEMTPAQWFAEAAAVGLGTELELASMRLALEHADSIPAEAFVSINAGPDTVLTPAAAALLANAPDRIVLEMTEHAAVSDYSELNRALHEFRSNGGRVAVDDAGAGFASLRHVLQLAPDMLKIDVSLIGRVRSDRAARALTSALVTFAAEMDQTVVAEGIEDEQTIAVLGELGVDYGQGYHLGRPARPVDLWR